MPGAYGKTVAVLQAALQGLYLEGKITQTLSEHQEYYYDGSQEISKHLFDKYTLAALTEYIDKGEAVDSEFDGVLRKKSSAQDYTVYKDVWQSLGLGMGETLSDMFELQSTKSNPTVKVTLKENAITIDYYPTFYVTTRVTEDIPIDLSYEAVAFGEAAVDRDKKITHITESKADQATYNEYVQAALDGFMRWQAASIQIQGITGTVEIKIHDKSGTIYNKTGNFSDYDFAVSTPAKAKVAVIDGGPYSGIVSDAFSWDLTKKLQIEVNYPVFNNKVSSLFEHEFGHILGLFDAYGYASLENTHEYQYGGHNVPNFFLPPAKIDGITVVQKSVMVDNDEVRPYVRTNHDWEMVLFAWQNNKLQCYVESAVGPKSQAFFY